MDKLPQQTSDFLKQLQDVLLAAGYSPQTLESYVREIRFICCFYPDLSPHDWTDKDIIGYMAYLKTVHHASYSKCKMTAQSVAFFFRHVLKRPYDVPSKLYPKREYKLPHFLSVDEMRKLIESCSSPKQKAIVELFYSSGMRLEELRMIKITDIDSKNNRILVRNGKGRKDRFTLLSKRALETLREYYRKQERKPVVYLFEGQKPGEPMWNSAIQNCVRLAYNHAGLSHKGHKVHALRHSFATHLLDSGVDIHSIKELLGHADIKTTMVYLHLQSSKRNMIVNPLDELYRENDQISQIPKNMPVI